MNTPAHLIFGVAAFGKPDAPKVTLAALAGALIPDLSLYLLAGYQLIVVGTDPNIVFTEMYYSPLWQGIFRVDNSFVIWGVLLGLAIAARSRWAIALCGAALLHIGLDFPLHHDDGRAHFWPLTTWIFESPVSYWDRGHHATIVGPLELIACIGLVAYSVIRFKSWWVRGLLLVLLAAQARVFYSWMFEFPSG